MTATNVPLAPYRNLPAPVSFSNYYGLNQRDFEFLRTDELEAVLSHDFGSDLNLRDTFHVGRNYRNSIISAPRFVSDTSEDINREFQSRDEVDSVITDEIDLTWRVTTFGRIDRPLSWRGALLYKPVDNGSIYFGAGSSFNPSGEDITLTAATANLGPEHTTAHGFGTKWDLLDRRLSVDAALLYTLKDNARTPGATAADPVTVLAGEQRARGFDLEFKGKLTRDWEVIGG